MDAADDLARRLLAGERAALARTISWAENAEGREETEDESPLLIRKHLRIDECLGLWSEVTRSSCSNRPL